MVNVYKKHSQISSLKFRKILRLFLLNIETTKVFAITNLSCQAINRIFRYIRLIIAKECKKVDYGYKQHFRVKHSANQFADGCNNINGIENFCAYVKCV